MKPIDIDVKTRLKLPLLLFMAIPLVALLIILRSFSVSTTTAAPYPDSTVITGISWDFANAISEAPGSDLWPVTWGADGHLYTAWGDGGGFGGTDSLGRAKIGFARIEGPPDDYTPFNINGGYTDTNYIDSNWNPASLNPGKPLGLLSVGGTLYGWMWDQSSTWPTAIRPITSTDMGATWQAATGPDVPVFPEAQANLHFSYFLNFGQDYAGARDTYVYMYGLDPDYSTPDVFLARTPKDQILNRSAYEFFAGTDAGSQPLWSGYITQTQSVFTDGGAPWVDAVGVVYHAALDRYLMTISHNGIGQLGIFDAPEPWGPWTTVAYYSDWGGLGTYEALGYQLPTKWHSSDGKTLWMITSSGNTGTGSFGGDSFGLIKGTLTTTVSVNQPPQAVDDTATTHENTAVIVDVLANDTDPDSGDTLSVTAIGAAGNGIAITNGITVTYNPSTGFKGVDTFSYTVSDGNGGNDTGVVSVTVVARPVISTVVPSQGSFTGGTVVTITGSYFQSGASVTLDGVDAGSVNVINATQITGVTPAHYPTQVDVTVTNPDGQTDTLTGGFSYTSPPVSLSVPHQRGVAGSTLQVPIFITNVNGLVAVDMAITFDSNVLSAQAVTLGPLLSGWGFAPNLANPDRISFSAATSSNNAISGTGIMAYLEFGLSGSPGAVSTLVFDSVSLNGGAIPAQPINGSITITPTYAITGSVQHWGGSTVGGVQLDLVGNQTYTGTSDGSGQYSIGNVPAANYTLTPSMSVPAGQVAGISGYDASLVLQHSAGITTLVGYAATAANTNEMGIIDAADAGYILDQAIGLRGAVWRFNPPQYTYADTVTTNQSQQDFTAVLLGDVSGSWPLPTSLASSARTAGEAARIYLQKGTPDAQGVVDVAVRLETAMDVYSLDLELAYDEARMTAVAVTAGPGGEEGLLRANLSEPGRMRIVFASALPVAAAGEHLIVLTFDLLDPGRDGALMPTASLNEHYPAVYVPETPSGNTKIYLPVLRN